MKPVGVVLNFTRCRRCILFRRLLESRDYLCSDCQQRQIKAMIASVTREHVRFALVALILPIVLFVGLVWRVLRP